MPTSGSTITTTATSGTTVWFDWCANTTHTTATTTATANSIWAIWSTAATGSNLVAVRSGNPRVVETAEQIRERAESLQRYRAEQAERAALERRIAEEANARAEQLLLGVLSAEQRETYQRARHIIVTGRSGRRYRVRRGRVGNVDVIGRNGHIESRLCAHPGVWTPDADVMLAQLLHLQHDDDEFCRTANRHQVLTDEGRILPALQ